MREGSDGHGRLDPNGHRIRIPLGSRTFSASWLMTLLTAAAIAAFLSFGHWQWSKGTLRAQQAEAFARGSDAAQPLGGRRLEEVPRFQRIRVKGVLDSTHQFLLDNRIHGGRPGYEVLTPLYSDAAGQDAILINRGWIPFSGFRDKLPDVSFAGNVEVELTGRVDELPVQGLASGRAAPNANAPWPKVTSYPHPKELGAMLGRPIQPRILLLDAEEPDGYVREWQPPGLTADRHWAYGVQWYAFAVLAFVLWVIFGLRNGRQK
jgi:surfeit locus 1 family protein